MRKLPPAKRTLLKEAEERTRKRQPKKKKAVGRKASKAQSVSSDEFEHSASSGTEEIVEIGDCIVVEE